MTHFQVESTKQAVMITAIKSQIDAHEDTIVSIHARMDVFETHISNQLAPLNEAVQAGGLAELIRKTILECMKNQFEYQLSSHNQPMEDALVSPCMIHHLIQIRLPLVQNCLQRKSKKCHLLPFLEKDSHPHLGLAGIGRPLFLAVRNLVSRSSFSVARVNKGLLFFNPAFCPHIHIPFIQHRKRASVVPTPSFDTDILVCS